MSDVPPPKDYFEKMMAAAKDPWYTTVLYEAWLEHADPEEPLWRVPYFGQVVRVGTADEVFAKRKRQHETDAAREDKDLGFHAVIDMFGADAIAWRIVSSASGPRSKMQAWANAEEIRLIDAHGGVLQDMDAKLEQTLNLTKGGQGDARAVWAGIDAMRRRALNRFKAAMEAYVEKHESALVPREYVDADGYPLGEQLHHFRQGQMRNGLPEEEEINAWAEALTGFHWDARESDAYREGFAQRGQERSRKAFDEFKAAMEAYVEEHGSALVSREYVDAHKYPLGVRLHSFRQGQMRKNTPWEDEANAWAEALPGFHWDARESDAYREELAQRGQERSRKAFDEFKAAMEAYVEEHGSALVSQSYVDDDGYPLGVRLHSFRQGHYWKGIPWEDEANAWAKTLPEWHWDARESDAYREGFAQRGQERSRKAFDAFKAAMEAYVEKHESALVSQSYVDDDGYPLGVRLSSFREGHYWKGTPWEDEAKAWAKTLPEWHWDARESDAYREELAQRGQERSRKAFDAFKAAMEAYVEVYKSALVSREYVDAHEYPLGVRLNAFRKGEMHEGTPWEDEAKAWAETLPEWHWDARESDAYRKGCVQRGQDQATNETAEKKTDRLAKLKTTMATDASKAKRRKISTDRARARAIDRRAL